MCHHLTYRLPYIAFKGLVLKISISIGYKAYIHKTCVYIVLNGGFVTALLCLKCDDQRVDQLEVWRSLISVWKQRDVIFKTIESCGRRDGTISMATVLIGKYNAIELISGSLPLIALYYSHKYCHNYNSIPILFTQSLIAFTFHIIYYYLFYFSFLYYLVFIALDLNPNP